MAGFGDFLGGALGYIADDMKTRRTLQLQDEQDEKRAKRDLDVYEKKELIAKRIRDDEKSKTAVTFEEDPETGMITGINALGEPVWQRKMGPGVQKKMQAALREAEAKADSAEFDSEHKDDIFELDKSTKTANAAYMSDLGRQARATAAGQEMRNTALAQALKDGTELPPAMRTGKGGSSGPKTTDVAAALDDYQARINAVTGSEDFDPETDPRAADMDDAQRMLNDARSIAPSNPDMARKMLEDVAAKIQPKPKLKTIK